jgi:hyaluronoglucosaminidase
VKESDTIVGVLRRTALLAATVALVFATPSPVVAAGYQFRGVIFGPYGKPWSHTDRLDMIGWMAEHGMNTYIHAAKDDVYQRAQWRDPYPPAMLEEFAEEISAGRSAAGGIVDWVPNLSPGVPLIPSATPPTGVVSRDVCFSCDADFAVVVAKLQPFYDRGVRTFMVSFDDVQKISTHPEDVIAYGVGDAAYGVMTASLLNRLQGEWPDATILTVPADYSGTAQTAYLAAFGQTLDPRIRVMWTGTATVSKTIAAADAKAYSDAISTPASGRRKLLVWDNFPVNDYNGNIFSSAGLPTAFKLNVGPYKGRGADLVDYVDGILSNPMNEAQATKIPLYTIAAYANDPASYVAANADALAESTWRAGIAELGGADGAEALYEFVAQMRSTPMDRSESVEFVARSTAFRDAFPTPFWQEPWGELMNELAAEGAAAPTLIAKGLPDAKFLYETRYHLAELERNAAAGQLAANLLAAERPKVRVTFVSAPSPTLLRVEGSVAPADPAFAARTLTELAPLEAERRSSPYSVHGDRLQHDFSDVYLLENRMDDFVNFAAETTTSWLPLAPLAASGPLTVTVNDVPATVASDGSFQVDVPTAPLLTVIVTDAAGNRTGERVAAP